MTEYLYIISREVGETNRYDVPHTITRSRKVAINLYKILMKENYFIRFRVERWIWVKSTKIYSFDTILEVDLNDNE